MKKMLITGTTQGIGKEMYERFKDCYDVTTINRRPFPGNNIICDLSDVAQVRQLCAALEKEPFDILINNAGGVEPVLFQDMQADFLVKCTNLNYHAPVLLMQALMDGMRRRNYGRVVNISSIASKSPRTLIPHYGAAKAALEAFSKSMAVYYSNCQVTVNCICPGGVDTDVSLLNRERMAQLQGKQPEYYNQAMSGGNGLGRMVSKQEVPDLAEFLISDHAAAISGQTINICGTKEVHG